MNNLRQIVRKIDYSQDEKTLEYNVTKAIENINNGNYDFSDFKRDTFTKNGKSRQIYSFEPLSTENILCHYLKQEIDSTFHVKYASRSKIINLFFNTLPVVKNLNDFVIVRADFKDFFNSILTEYVFETYIKKSLLARSNKNILEQYVTVFDRCYAGLCLSNEMAEIVSRDFDRLIKAKLEKYGIFFYERFVDDMLIMLNSYVDQDTFLDIVNSVIREVFGDCPVILSSDQNKFSFITLRDMQRKSEEKADEQTESFTYLGYEFSLTYNNGSNKMIFKYGISEQKRERYKHIIEQAFIDYKKTGNTELFRHRIKLFSTRTVISRSLGNNRYEWLTNGIVANYNELRHHLKDINDDTKSFLKNLYTDLLNEYGLSTPYFMPNGEEEPSGYNLYSCLQRNRSIVFEKKIGVHRKDLIRWIKKINPGYEFESKRYYQLVMEYFELLDVNSTIS